MRLFTPERCKLSARQTLPDDRVVVKMQPLCTRRLFLSARNISSNKHLRFQSALEVRVVWSQSFVKLRTASCSFWYIGDASGTVVEYCQTYVVWCLIMLNNCTNMSLLCMSMW